jgi:four helix bundle protein
VDARRNGGTGSIGSRVPGVPRVGFCGGSNGSTGGSRFESLADLATSCDPNRSVSDPTTLHFARLRTKRGGRPWPPRCFEQRMAGWKDFREIAAWQHARALKIRVDEFLERPNVRANYKLHSQLHDAVRSAPSNIAEGFGKFGNKEFARYARIAKASELEVLNHLIDLRDQRLISGDELLLSEHAARKALKAVVGLIGHLESTPDPPRTPKRDGSL